MPNAVKAIHGDILSYDKKQGKILGHFKLRIDKNFEFDLNTSQVIVNGITYDINN